MVACLFRPFVSPFSLRCHPLWPSFSHLPNRILVRTTIHRSRDGKPLLDSARNLCLLPRSSGSCLSSLPTSTSPSSPDVMSRSASFALFLWDNYTITRHKRASFSRSTLSFRLCGSDEPREGPEKRGWSRTGFPLAFALGCVLMHSPGSLPVVYFIFQCRLNVGYALSDWIERTE